MGKTTVGEDGGSFSWLSLVLSYPAFKSVEKKRSDSIDFSERPSTYCILHRASISVLEESFAEEERKVETERSERFKGVSVSRSLKYSRDKVLPDVCNAPLIIQA